MISPTFFGMFSSIAIGRGWVCSISAFRSDRGSSELQELAPIYVRVRVWDYACVGHLPAHRHPPHCLPVFRLGVPSGCFESYSRGFRVQEPTRGGEEWALQRAGDTRQQVDGVKDSSLKHAVITSSIEGTLKLVNHLWSDHTWRFNVDLK